MIFGVTKTPLMGYAEGKEAITVTAKRGRPTALSTARTEKIRDVRVTPAERLAFKLKAHLNGLEVSELVRTAVRAFPVPAPNDSEEYCSECHATTPMQPTTGDILIGRTEVVVKDVPMIRCAHCGTEYEDVFLGALLEEEGGFLHIGEIRMADLLNPPELKA